MIVRSSSQVSRWNCGCGHIPHSISHPLGWRSRHTGPRTANSAPAGDSCTRTCTNLSGSLESCGRVGGTIPFCTSWRRTLYSIAMLRPCAR
jgi:hypothetical protein